MGIEKGLLEQVIVNLSVNARDAMACQGALTFTTTNVKLPASIDGAASGSVTEYPVIEAADHGCGMSAEILERMALENSHFAERLTSDEVRQAITGFFAARAKKA